MAAAELAAPVEVGKLDSASAAAPEDELPESTMLGEMPPMLTVPQPGGPAPVAAPGDDWFLSFDGEQEGPFSLPRALERLRTEAPGGKEAHAWRPGFLVWLPVEEVPELSGGGLDKPKPAISTMQPRPIAPVAARSASPVASITKDPSGPRAALSVSAGARPTTPSAARAPIRPAAPPVHAMFGDQASDDPPSLDGSALEPDNDEEDEDDDSGAGPDLNISNEASGLVNLAHLAAAAMGKKPAGPIFMNGHTGRAPRLDPEPLAALEPVENPSAPPPPVVVITAPAQGGASPLFKYLAIGAVPLLLGMGGAVAYLLTHRPAAETIIVTEPSRHVDDSTITMNDPNLPRGTVVDPKHPGIVRRVQPVMTGKGPVPIPGKPGQGQSLADLYKDDGEKQHTVTGITGHGSEQGGQVSQQAIIGVVNANKRQLSLCYERALKHDSSLKSGRVPIQVTVGMSGRVTNVTIAEAQYASSELGQCFQQTVKRWSFPASDAQYTTEFPFILQGQ